MSPEAYARALQHQEAAARDYEAAALIYGSPFQYRLPPLLVKIPDDNERPRRYSGNSHQRRKQRRAQRSHR